MSVQVRKDLTSVNQQMEGKLMGLDSQTIAQYAGLNEDVNDLQVLALNATADKFVVYGDTQLAAAAGYIPVGLYKGDTIAEADIEADDVTGCDVITMGAGAVLSEDQIKLAGSVTLDSVPTNGTKTIRQYLMELGIGIAPVKSISTLEGS